MLINSLTVLYNFADTKIMKKSIFLLSAVLVLSPAFIFADTKYQVVKGDTLYSISKKYQLTVAELRSANNLSESDVLKAGQILIIPEADIGNAVALSSSNSKTNANASSSIKTKIYTVEKGDTLYGIAKKFNTTVAILYDLNKLNSNSVIKTGQKLNVPEKTEIASSTNTNSTKKNETVISEPVPDTRTYGKTVTADSTTKWPVQNPTVTQVKGKVSGVQLSAMNNEAVKCILEGTVMYVGTYRGFGQVVFVQSKTGLIYSYTGLGSVKVRKGDYAVSGTELGTAGVDSITGKAQITLMVFQNGQPIDPRTAPRS
jgi:lipoprotein YgeR